MPGMGERWVELALTSCPSPDLSLPPPTPTCHAGFQRSFEPGDLWQGGGRALLSTAQLQPIFKGSFHLTENKIPCLPTGAPTLGLVTPGRGDRDAVNGAFHISQWSRLVVGRGTDSFFLPRGMNPGAGKLPLQHAECAPTSTLTLLPQCPGSRMGSGSRETVVGRSVGNDQRQGGLARLAGEGIKSSVMSRSRLRGQRAQGGRPHRQGPLRSGALCVHVCVCVHACVCAMSVSLPHLQLCDL